MHRHKAEALARCVPHVVVMRTAISDKAAIVFSVGFYKALAAGRSIPASYTSRCAVLPASGAPLASEAMAQRIRAIAQVEHLTVARAEIVAPLRRRDHDHNERNTHSRKHCHIGDAMSHRCFAPFLAVLASGTVLFAPFVAQADEQTNALAANTSPTDEGLEEAKAAVQKAEAALQEAEKNAKAAKDAVQKAEGELANAKDMAKRANQGASANDVELADTGWRVQIDQDVFWPPSADKDFTQGTEFEWAGRRTRGWFPRHLFRLIDWPAWKLLHEKKLLPKVDGPSGYEASTFQFGYSGFTPRKGEADECHGFAPPRVNKKGEGCVLSDTDPIMDDRPYAGLLYVRTRRASVGERSAWVSELTLGLLGTNIGKGVQTFIHRHVSDDVDPGGWHHQISDGGELTARYRLAHRWMVVPDLWECDGARLVDLSSNVEGNLGYYTNVGASGRVRLGLIRSTPLTLEMHGSEPTITTMNLNAGKRYLKEAYVWGTWGASLWGYNALLQGQFRKTDVALAFDDGQAQLRRFTRTWQLGATVRVGHISATYNVTWQSPVFDGPNSRPHSWGTVLLQFQPKGFTAHSSNATR